MKYTYYLLLLALLISACEDEDMLSPDPGLPEEEEEVVNVVDSFELNLVELPVINESGNFSVLDFTTQIPGFIWGTTYRREAEKNVLFSYNISDETFQYFTPPGDLGILSPRWTVAGPDGKLYLYSTGFIYSEVAVFEIESETWSSITIPEGVNRVIADLNKKDVWIAHGAGVSRYRNGELLTYDDTNSGLQKVTSGANTSFFGGPMAVDSDGVVWYANQGRLFQFRDEAWTEHPNSPFTDITRISQISPAESGGVFVKVSFGALTQVKFNEVVNTYTNEELTVPSRPAFDIIERGSDESIIYSHTNGFSYYSLSADTLIIIDNTNSELPQGQLNLYMERDANGVIWFGGHNVFGTLPDEW
ncbi:hypothetical protein [Lewinella sp. 4G2]|uniref:hypothetical protein n=1 Tax=Lewinella sp. 4G2 TaxID=1803372 RepID=UPI0007B4BF1D|nr:hypothetical protein [Lewinella sp. 4G2]OAV45157.1 hypothetical protein A3850_011940 [Lewinella sp. 4G2]